MYFEIYKQGKVVKRGKDILGSLSWSNELMYTPSLNITLPLYYKEYLSGREEVKVFVNGKCFWGIVTGIELTLDTIEVSLEHIIHEWTYRQISVNHAVKDGITNIVYRDLSDHTKEGTYEDGEVTETLTANNCYWNPEEDYEKLVGDERKKALIEHANAKCLDQDNNTVEITTVLEGPVEKDTVKIPDSDEYEPELDAYKVRYRTKRGTYLDVQKSIYPDGTATVEDELADIYADKNFAYPNWKMNWLHDAGSRKIDYVYSRQNKLEALNDTCELTPDLFWRVRFVNEKVVDVSPFGDDSGVMLSKRQYMINEPKVEYDFADVINLATVYSEKEDTGMSSMTLREVYNDPSLQEDGFPCIILRENVNNERNYTMYTTQYPSLAPNNELEYAVMDEESIACEGGTVIEGTYAFSNLSPFSKVDDDGNTKEITDDDRIEAAKTAYKAAIRKLKQARRNYSISFECEPLPVTLNPGDKVRFVYDHSIFNLDACTNYMKRLLTYNDDWYVESIDYEISEDGYEVDTIKLSQWVRIDRDVTETT